MKINLSPQRRDDTYTLVRVGDTLILNGEVFDFTPLPEGATLPASAVGNDWFFGEITRKDGMVELTLTLPHAADASEAARFPEPLVLTENGVVELPV